MPALPNIPGVCWTLAAVALILLTTVSVFTHHRPWQWRLPIRFSAFMLCACLVWVSADLALRQQVSSIDQIVQDGHAQNVPSLTINAGSVRSKEHLMRPSVAVHIPGGFTLPLVRLHAGSYAPVGTAAISAVARGNACALQDTTVSCTHTDGTLHIDY